MAAETNWIAHITLGAQSSDKSSETDSDGMARSRLYGGSVGMLGIESPTLLGFALDMRFLLASSRGQFSYEFLRNNVTYTDQRLKGTFIRMEPGLGLKWNLINAPSFKFFVGAMGILARASIAYDQLDYSSRHSGEEGLMLSENQSYSGYVLKSGMDFLGQEFGFRLSAELVDYKTKKFETLSHSTLTHKQVHYLLSYLQRF